MAQRDERLGQRRLERGGRAVGFDFILEQFAGPFGLAVVKQALGHFQEPRRLVLRIVHRQRRLGCRSSRGHTALAQGGVEVGPQVQGQRADAGAPATAATFCPLAPSTTVVGQPCTPS